MKVRIKFSKQGEMRFIGHLDLQRFFQKIMRKAGIPIRFTEGMSPHMVMSFAAPLGVGLTSDAEYVDIETVSDVSTRDALRLLNCMLPEGLAILDWREIEEGRSQNAMALVRSADYTLRFPETPAEAVCPGSAGPEVKEESLLSAIMSSENIDAFLAEDSILIQKENKKAAKKNARRNRGGGAGKEVSDTDFIVTADIRPMIYLFRACPEKRELFLRCACGSSANLKPEDAVRAYLSFLGYNLAGHSLKVNRCELYADGFIPLNELGSIVTDV